MNDRLRAICFAAALAGPMLGAMSSNAANAPRVSTAQPENAETAPGSASLAVATDRQESSLLGMAAAGKEKELAALLESGVDVNVTDEENYTALHLACIEGQLNCAKLLLKHGARMDLYSQSGGTALDEAMQCGNTAIVEEFLKSGIEADARDRCGQTLLMRAAAHGLPDLVTILLAHGASARAVNRRGDTALHNAALWDEPSIVAALLEAGADINAANKSGFTPLFHAVMRKRTKTTEALLAAEADVSVKSPLGRTALHLAVQEPDAVIAAMLLAAGASPNACATCGDTPLSIAIRDDNAEMVKLFVEHGAELYGEDSRSYPRILEALQGCSPEVRQLLPPPDYTELAKSEAGTRLLSCALQIGDAQLADRLLAAGTDISAKDREGNTILHEAVVLGNARLCEQILAKGADVAACNRAGDTPLTCAIRSKNKDTIKLLLRNGAKVFAADSRSWPCALEALMACPNDVAALLSDVNWNLSELAQMKDVLETTLLHAAVQQEKAEIVTLLLSIRADPNVTDFAGMTPLHLAMRQRNNHLARLLLAAGADLSLRNRQGSTPLDVARSAGLDLDKWRTALVEEGDSYVNIGDRVAARLAYGCALRLESDPFPRSMAAHSLVLTFCDNPGEVEESFATWLSSQNLSDKDVARVYLALAEYRLGQGEIDEALNALVPAMEKKTSLSFAAQILRALCLSENNDHAGATAELKAIAADPPSKDLGTMAKYFLARGFDGMQGRKNILLALGELAERDEFVAWARAQKFGAD